ncbi:unnamed protein product [Blepharisma stoltei]|uniref:TmcB/TmcC TPR repeats domain-containing protein n=1 Tax=Blepharisma stoltei TaxID=1481888 RepID=A0AAU9JBG9_9CILI|nr:unnamed protein product [Blepharisma stoltei]
MFEKNEFLISENSAHEFSQNESSFENKIFQLYNYFGTIFSAKHRQNFSRKGQIIIELIINIIISLQMNSLCWYSDMKISNWDNYKYFWEFLGYFNIESFCDWIGIFNICFYGAFSLLSYVFLSIFLLGVLKLYWKNTPKYIVIFSRKIIYPLTSLIFIPLMMILIETFKYSVNIQPKKTKYGSDSHEEKTADLGGFGVFLSISYFILLLVFVYGYELFTADVNHSNSHKNFKARSKSDLDVFLIFVYALMCAIYYSFSTDTAIYLQIFQVLISILVTYLFISTLPYYDPLENSIQSCKLCTLGVTSLSFIFAKFADDASITVIFFLFLQPIIMLLVVRRVDWNSAHIDFRMKYQWHFELKIRKLLINYEESNRDAIFEMFSDFQKDFTIKKTDLFGIWETNFCLRTLKDVRLGRVKLLKIKEFYPTIEGGIQKWRIDKIIKKENLSDMRYIQYLIDFGNVKSFDKELCYMFLVLWDEIASRHPDFNKLMDLVKKISDNTEKITSLYSSLIGKYRNFEVFDFYSSFLDNLLGDYEEAMIINRKKNALHIMDTVNDYYKIDIFGPYTCVFLISLNRNSFGCITSMNDKTKQFLGIPSYSRTEYNFMDFIPWPYNLHHTEYMKQFYDSCSTTAIPLPEKFFIQDYQGFLLECKISATLTTANDDAYVLVLLLPSNSSRQVILLSDEMNILSYSILVPGLFNSNKKTIHKGACILDYLPQVSKWSHNEPHFSLFNGRMLIFYIIDITFKSSKLHLIAIFHDSDEIELVRKGFSYQRMSSISYNEGTNIPKDMLAMREKVIRDFKAEEDNKYHRKNSIKIHSSNDKEDADDGGDIVLSGSRNQLLSVSSSSKGKEISKNFSKGTENSLKVFKYVVFFSIIAMIITNVSILLVVEGTVSHEVSLGTIGHLGEILFQISSYSELVRTLDAEVADKRYNISRDLPLFTNEIGYLADLKSTILSDYDYWSYCSSSKIVKENLIPMWFFNTKTPYMKNLNLYDTIGEFIAHGYSFIDAINTNSDYHPDLSFLVINSLTFTYEYISNSLKDLENCEVDKIISASFSIHALLILGIFIIVCCAGVILYFAFSIQKQYDEFWYHIRRITVNSYGILKDSAIERLATTFGVLDIPPTDIQPKLNKNTIRVIRSRILYKYTKRLLAFVMISLSFYFLIYFYLYDKCETDMKHRPALLSYFVYTKAWISRMGYWARDVNNPRTLKYYPNSYDFKNPALSLNETIKDLKTKDFELRNNDYKNLMSASLKAIIFEKTNNKQNFLKYGTLSGLNFIILESYYIGSQIKVADWERSDFIGNYTILQDMIGNEYDQANQDSKDAIYDELDTLIYVTEIYSVVLFLLFFVYYLPFLRDELEVIKKLRTLMTIVYLKKDQGM